MFIESDGLITELVYISGILYALVLYAAVRYAPWYKLFARGNSNIYFGALVSIFFLWLMGTRFEVGTVFHLSALTSLTLMVGWQFAIIGGSLVLAGVLLGQQGDWNSFLPSSLVGVLVPVMVTWLILMVIRSLLPKHFFIYIFFNAFFAGAFTALSAATAAASLLMISGMPFDYLWNRFIIWFPLMLFPEAVLNGWIMTILVGLKPHWVATFRDEEYLKGK